MQEDQENADWTDESDGKEEDREKFSTYRIPVGEFITYNLLWYIPAQEQAGDERRQWHQKLRCQIITVGEEILTEEAQSLYRSLRKGTEYCDNTTDNRLNPGSLRTTYLALFINKGGTNLVHRDGRGKSSQHQQAIEQYRDDVTNHRHIAKSLLENIRQGDEDKRRTTIRLNSHRESCREDHQSCQYGYERIDGYNLSG